MAVLLLFFFPRGPLGLHSQAPSGLPANQLAGFWHLWQSMRPMSESPNLRRRDTAQASSPQQPRSRRRRLFLACRPSHSGQACATGVKCALHHPVGRPWGRHRDRLAPSRTSGGILAATLVSNTSSMEPLPTAGVIGPRTGALSQSPGRGGARHFLRAPRVKSPAGDERASASSAGPLPARWSPCGHRKRRTLTSTSSWYSAALDRETTGLNEPPRDPPHSGTGAAEVLQSSRPADNRPPSDARRAERQPEESLQVPGSADARPSIILPSGTLARNVGRNSGLRASEIL